ncbi:MAG: peptidoglycan DD-metalloendopeptidase family protein [Actinobacteria bacterium]|nr:peptidoglycan DD-metalloendopeptidase family protein [Actinomycetota bacterium]
MTRATRILVVALALVAGAVAMVPARAATTTTRPATSNSSPTAPAQVQLSNLSKKIVEASREESELLKKLDAANARKSASAQRITELDQELPAAQAKFAAASERLAVVDGELAVAEERLSRASAQLKFGKSALKQRAIDAYVGRPDASMLSVGVRVATFREYVALRQYMNAVIRTHTRIVHQYDDLQRGAADLQDAVARRRAEAKAQRDVVARERNNIAAARTSQEQARTQAASSAAEAANLLKEVRGRRAEFQAKYNQLKAQSDAIARLLKGRQSGQTTAPSGKGVLSSPIPGAAISSTFGPRVHPIFGDVRMHTGVDFDASEGTPIHAAADGVVVSAGPQGGYGNATIIDHGNSLATLYAHQSRIAVAAGQSVKRGQVIGYVGHTGYATGPHLHFEVRVNGTPVDPMRYL